MNFRRIAIFDPSFKITRAKKEFGFEAKADFEEGLKKTINWYLAQNH